MIEFRCNGCNKEFKVPESNAGKKGKCPKCKTVITVPFASDNEIIFDEKELTCSDPNLQKLYEKIIPMLDNQLKRHVISENLLLFDIYTDEDQIRSQRVVVAPIGSASANDYNYGSFIIISDVGKINSPDDAVLALRLAHIKPFANVAINENDELSIRVLTHSTMEIDMVCRLIISTAIGADKLEELIFNWDLE